MVQYRGGQKIKVVSRSIQRSNGAVWKGDGGEILAETGDRYRVRFTNGFMADTIKDHRIKEA